MCMCGGIIEIGLITALVGYVGKKMHKCKCTCHEEHVDECKHCSHHIHEDKDPHVKLITECQKENDKILNKKKKIYQIIQYAFLTLGIIGVCVLAYGVYDHYKTHHDHCEHEQFHNN